MTIAGAKSFKTKRELQEFKKKRGIKITGTWRIGPGFDQRIIEGEDYYLICYLERI